MKRRLPRLVPPRSSAPRRFRQPPLRVCLASLLATALWTACGGAAAPASEVQSYVVEGEVLYLPTASRPEITIRHQAVDDFVDMHGDVVGMDAMTMPFPLAEGVSIQDLDSGDTVRFTLEVEWDGELPYRISRIEELPDAG